MSLSKSRIRLLRRLRSRRQRRREACFLVEGTRSARAALDAAAAIRFAVVSPRLGELDNGPALRERMDRAAFDVVEIADDELSELADTVSPQGVLLVGDEPRRTLQDLWPQSDRSGVFIADAIQDPANLATLIRTGAAFGLAGLVALDGCVDPFNAKVVRGSAGGCFHLPVVGASWQRVEPWLSSTGLQLLGAAADGRDVGSLRAERGVGRAGGVGLKTDGFWALAVGNEGAGLRAEVKARAEALVAVPVRGGSDSLSAGVAAAILAYELTRRREAP